MWVLSVYGWKSKKACVEGRRGWNNQILWTKGAASHEDKFKGGNPAGGRLARVWGAGKSMQRKWNRKEMMKG